MLGAVEARIGQGRMFFFEKKEPKNFCLFRRGRCSTAGSGGNGQ
jgi:hypothetical protein